MHSLTQSCEVQVANELRRSAAESAAAHAYIFEGAKGLGKRRTALCFAAALICDTHSGEPCGKCDNCIQAFGKNNPDIMTLSLDDLKKKSIGAADIRNIISDVYIRPFKADKKIYIIEDGDDITPEAQNAMLKVLEEPPAYAVFIICTTNIGLILPTVVSRSRVIRFSGVSFAAQKAYIESHYSEYKDCSSFLASLCKDSHRVADEQLGDGEFFDKLRLICNHAVDLLLGADEEKVFEFAALFDAKKDAGAMDMSLALDIMLLVYTFLLRIKQTGDARANAIPATVNAEETALRVSSKKLAYAADRTELAAKMLKRKVPAKMIALNLAISIFRY